MAKEPLAAVDDTWRHYRSPNFELYSHDGEFVSRALLHDLELLRAVFIDRFKFVERARVDVTVYRFRTVDEFTAYGSEGWSKGHNFRGFYLSGPDRAVIAVAPSEDPERARATIFHEYIHHLFRASEQDPPAWFNEGMAELLAAIKVVGGSVEIGRPHPGRIYVLHGEKLLPLETLFAVDHGSPIYRSNDHTGLFYAQSWALLHYWYFGKSELSKEAVARFVRVAGHRKAATSVDLRAFFRECFGMDYPEMQRRLERYVTSGSYQFGRQPAPKIDPKDSYVARPALRDEMRVRLAELALRTNRTAMARFLVLDAAAKPGAEPRLFEVLGADALHERDETEARDRWEQAIVAGSTNGAIYRELGLLESRAWFREFDYYFRLPVDRAAKLRERLQRAIAHEPEQTAAYEMLAWVEAFAEEPVFANINAIQRRFDLLRQKQRTLVALALVRVRHGDVNEARSLLNDLEKLEWDDWAAQAGEVVRAKLEDRLPRTVAQLRAPRATQVEIDAAPPAEAPQMKVPSIELPGSATSTVPPK